MFQEWSKQSELCLVTTETNAGYGESQASHHIDILNILTATTLKIKLSVYHK